MEVMEMRLDDKVTVKEKVCGGRRLQKVQTRGKTIVVSNRKLENSAFPAECRCTAQPPRPRVWPIKIKLNKRVVVGQ